MRRRSALLLCNCCITRFYSQPPEGHKFRVRRVHSKGARIRRSIVAATPIVYPAARRPALDQPDVPGLRIGTSSWSAESWVGPFYPPGTRPADFLRLYAEHYSTVEVDSTYYRVPSAAMVRNWYARTPAEFVFAAKFPGAITHEKVLSGCEEETQEFLGVMDLLGEKLGPLLLQFPYFNRQAFAGPQDFIDRLERFLDALPPGRHYAVEIRNRQWLGESLLARLRQRGVALALADQAWMPRIGELAAKFDVLTAGFSYIRLIGDRQGIEKMTKSWDKLVVDREAETQTWVSYVRQFLHRGAVVYLYVNNHWAGFAPGSIALFRDIWSRTPATGP